MRLSPAVWGPLLWNSIHTVALGYPKEPSYSDKKSAKEFYESFQFLIPCPMCRDHFKEHLKNMPITPHLDRREDLFKWTVVLHNAVNRSLKKPELTELEAILYYKRLSDRNTTPIINKEMFEEMDMRSLIRGGFIGGGVVFLTCMSIYYFSRADK